MNVFVFVVRPDSFVEFDVVKPDLEKYDLLNLYNLITLGSRTSNSYKFQLPRFHNKDGQIFLFAGQLKNDFLSKASKVIFQQNRHCLDQWFSNNWGEGVVTKFWKRVA